MKLRNRQRQNLRTKQIVRYVSYFTLAIGLIRITAMGINYLLSTSTSHAKTVNLLQEDAINSGETIIQLHWDNASIENKLLFDQILSISKDAYFKENKNGFSGIAAGSKGKDLDIVLKQTDLLNEDGLDLSLDLSKQEEDGYFFSRGSSFQFGFDKKGIVIRYELTAANGKSYFIENNIECELINNKNYNCRFLYTPQTGKGEVFINKILIWSNQAAPNCRLTWKDKTNLVIGKNINGNGKDLALLNNIVIKKTGKSNTSPMDLLGFTADLKGNEVEIQWYTAKENGTDYFKIEKSFDTKEYQEVGRVKAAGISSGLKTYTLKDSNPNTGISYYRIALNNNTNKSIWLPVIALKIKPELLIPKNTSSN